MSRAVYLGALVIAGFGAATWYVLTRVPSAAPDSATGSALDSLDEVVVSAKKLVGASWPYPRGSEYQSTFDDVSAAHGIPPGLLARQAYQESHFRADIISGATVSSAGAIGIMQIVPRWHPDVNAYDPIESINYAAQFLRRLYDKFNTWPLALAAYNWGEGNLAKHTDPTTWPKETQAYVSQITSDVEVA